MTIELRDDIVAESSTSVLSKQFDASIYGTDAHRVWDQLRAAGPIFTARRISLSPPRPKRSSPCSVSRTCSRRTRRRAISARTPVPSRCRSTPRSRGLSATTRPPIHAPQDASARVQCGVTVQSAHRQLHRTRPMRLHDRPGRAAPIDHLPHIAGAISGRSRRVPGRQGGDDPAPRSQRGGAARLPGEDQRVDLLLLLPTRWTSGPRISKTTC